MKVDRKTQKLLEQLDVDAECVLSRELRDELMETTVRMSKNAIVVFDWIDRNTPALDTNTAKAIRSLASDSEDVRQAFQVGLAIGIHRLGAHRA